MGETMSRDQTNMATDEVTLALSMHFGGHPDRVFGGPRLYNPPTVPGVGSTLRLALKLRTR
jgi:hypothetical protein